MVPLSLLCSRLSPSIPPATPHQTAAPELAMQSSELGLVSAAQTCPAPGAHKQLHSADAQELHIPLTFLAHLAT